LRFSVLRMSYSSPRITAELRDRGEVVTVKTVAKIMGLHGPEGASLRMLVGL
jgi:putative transposase